MKKTIILGIITLLISGCSVSSLRCGIDEEQSYVELINVPQDISSQARHFAGLCGFSYQEDST